MNTKNIKALLITTADELNVSVDNYDIPDKQYSIVELCIEVFKFSTDDSINFCHKYIGLFDTVYISQEVLEEGPLAKIGDAIKNARGRRGMSMPRPEMAPSKLNVVGKTRNFLGNDKAVHANSPMIKVENNKTGKVNYFSLQNLNLNNPGHHEILTNIIGNLTKEGDVATQVNPGSGDWLAAQRNRKLIQIKPELVGSQDQRAGMSKALQDLSALIKQKQAAINTNLAVSPQEVGELKNQANAILNQLAGEAAKPEDPAKKVEAAKEATADIKAAEVAPVAPTGPAPAGTAAGTTTPPAAPAGFQSEVDKQYGIAPKPAAEEPALPISHEVTPTTAPMKIEQGLPTGATGNAGLTAETGKPSIFGPGQPPVNDEQHKQMYDTWKEQLLGMGKSEQEADEEAKRQANYDPNKLINPVGNPAIQAPAPIMPQAAAPTGTAPTQLPTAPYTAPTPNVSVPNVAQRPLNKLNPSQFTIPQPAVPQVKQITPTTSTAANVPAANLQAPAQVPQFNPNEPYTPLLPNKANQSPEEIVAANSNLGRFSAQQNAARKNAEIAPTDLPQAAAQQKAKTDLTRYLDQKRAQR